jgi:hypothetical protein
VYKCDIFQLYNIIAVVILLILSVTFTFPACWVFFYKESRQLLTILPNFTKICPYETQSYITWNCPYCYKVWTILPNFEICTNKFWWNWRTAIYTTSVISIVQGIGNKIFFLEKYSDLYLMAIMRKKYCQ